MVDTIIRQLEESSSYIKGHYAHELEVGIVLGSGLDNLVRNIEVEKEIDFGSIPNFPLATVMGHPGKLILGKAGKKRIIAMAGRFHYYEGYSPQQVVFPIRVMKWLGVNTLLISNASGGMNSSFKVGDLMLIKDHISLFVVNPLIGKNLDELGLRFPDMSEPYNRQLIAKMKTIATRLNIPVKEGVYAGVTGPTFETRSEYKMLHMAGADAVGMSTVQEVIAARHMGMRVAALCVITDLGIREEDNLITHEEVLTAARQAEPRLTAIFRELIEEL
ncbi:MAG: purine-nucleoside phosphorylase [Chitinophagales bacterium]